MNKPFFSILIPVYNVERYLPACLESVLRQSFTDYEVILVDDGSKDSSGQICDEYAARYPQIIHVQHKPNQGLISARRAGLKFANGHYICFLDSDDCWVDNILCRLYEVIQTTDCDVVYYTSKRIDENGKLLNAVEPTLFHQEGILDKKTVFERMISTSLINSLWTKCCKYELFDVGADYSQYYSIQNGEDLIQSLPVLYKANTFYYLHEPLYLYRVNTTSITHTYRKGQYKTINIIRPLLYSYIEKMGLDTEDNKKAFYRFYLSSLWESIQSAYYGIPSIEERTSVFIELHSFEFVQRGKDYLARCSFPLRTRLGLFVFYRSPEILNSYLGIYLPVIEIVRRIKSSLGGKKL